VICWCCTTTRPAAGSVETMLCFSCMDWGAHIAAATW
jgi:hypothetical protein